MGLHWQELIVILVIVLVLFGPKRLPEIGSSLGRGIRGFRDSMNGTESVSAHAATITETSTTTPAATERPVAVPVEAVETSQTEQR